MVVLLEYMMYNPFVEKLKFNISLGMFGKLPNQKWMANKWIDLVIRILVKFELANYRRFTTNFSNITATI